MVFVYVLRLTDGKWFVGHTTDVAEKSLEHFVIDDVEWKSMYKPLGVVETIDNCDVFDVTKWTLKYMAKYGIENVRGGCYRDIIFTPTIVSMIEREIKTALEVNDPIDEPPIPTEVDADAKPIEKLPTPTEDEKVPTNPDAWVRIIARNGEIRVKYATLQKMGTLLSLYDNGVVDVEYDVSEVNKVVGYLVDSAVGRTSDLIAICKKYGIDMMELKFDWRQLIDYVRRYVEDTLDRKTGGRLLRGCGMETLYVQTSDGTAGTDLHPSYYEYTDDFDFATVKVMDETFMCSVSPEGHRANRDTKLPTLNMGKSESERLYDVLEGNLSILSVSNIYFGRLIQSTIENKDL